MKRTALAAIVVVAVAAAWLFVLPAVPVAQPLAFSHAAHASTACGVCHDGVTTAERARIPGPAICARCHATAPPAVDATLWKSVQDGGAPWVRVTRVPEHVVFSHRRHVALGGLACESCHGDAGRRTTPPPRAAARLDMDGCVSCHRRERVTEDCAGCHR